MDYILNKKPSCDISIDLVKHTPKTYVLNGQFTKRSIRISRKCSLGHGQFLVLKLDNLGY
jgi:hypothetical protein